MYGVWGGLSEDERLILLGLHRRHRVDSSGLDRADVGEAGSVRPVGHVGELTMRR